MRLNLENPFLVIRSATFKQTSLTLTATLINGILGMVFYIFLARELGPSDFGLFSLSIVVLALTADIGNFGANTGIVNFVSKFIKSDTPLALKYLKIGFLYKLFMGLAVILFGCLLSPFLAEEVFKKPEMFPLLRLAFLGVGSTWLFSFTTSYYQATQKFRSWGMIQIFTNLIRLLGVVCAFYYFHLDIYVALTFYIIAPFIGFIVSFVNISFEFIREKFNKANVNTFFSFNKWVGISAIAGATSSRADTFILGRLATSAGIGVYSAAGQIVQVVPQLIGAIGTVVAPKFSSFDNDNKMFGYFKKLQLMVMVIAGVMVLSIPIVKIVTKVFFGPEYDRSFGIFVILFVSMLVFLISIPVHNVIIYYYQYPKLFSYLSVINLLVVILLAYFLTLKFGISGTAYASLVGNTVNFLVPMVWFKKKIKLKATSS